MTTIFALALACALLNHVRGGGALLGLSSLIERLPGRPLWYVAPVIGLLAGLMLGWWQGLIVGATYLLWGTPAWGRWFTLNREDRTISGAPSWYELWIERVGDRIPWGGISGPRNDYACFTIRNTVLLLPLALVSPWLILLGPAQTVAYELGWRIRPAGGVAVGELIFGALVGVAVALPA